MFQLTDKAGFLIREYVKFSLYDRISTRPFLAPIEKKWIAFQLLYALHQCHKSGVSRDLVCFIYFNQKVISCKKYFLY